MKQFRTLAMGVLAATFAFTGCSSDDGVNSENGQATRVALQVTSGIQTRATDTDWEAGDKIGIYMLNGTETDTYLNVPYTTAAAGEDAAFAPDDEVIYLPVDGTERDFVAYYPYANLTDGVYAINLADQTDQSAIDFMQADKVTGKSRTDYRAAFSFNHRLSKIVVALRAGEGLTTADLAGLSLSLTGQPTAGTFNVISGTAAVPAADKGTITLLTAADGTASEGIVFPSADYAGMEFVIATSSAGTYRWSLSDSQNATRFEAGKRYLYTITVKRTGLDVKASINDWDAGNGAGDTGSAE